MNNSVHNVGLFSNYFCHCQRFLLINKQDLHRLQEIGRWSNVKKRKK